MPPATWIRKNETRRVASNDNPDSVTHIFESERVVLKIENNNNNNIKLKKNEGMIHAIGLKSNRLKPAFESLEILSRTREEEVSNFTLKETKWGPN